MPATPKKWENCALVVSGISKICTQSRSAKKQNQAANRDCDGKTLFVATSLVWSSLGKRNSGVFRKKTPGVFVIESPNELRQASADF